MKWFKRLFQGGEEDSSSAPAPMPSAPEENFGMESPSELPEEGSQDFGGSEEE